MDENPDDIFPEAVYEDPHVDSGIELLLYKGTWLTKYFFKSREVLDDCKNFPLENSDVIVVSFPKSGTTWVQEIVCRIASSNKIINGCKENENVHQAPIANMEQKFPMLEDFQPGVKEIEKLSSPRFLKTHLSYQLLPKKAQEGVGKIIYIARNPKDVFVSYFHFLRHLKGAAYKGELGDLFKIFMNGKVSWGPWLGHVKTFWEHRYDPNILFITYEEMQENQSSTTLKIAEFLGVTLSKQQLDDIIKATTFESMKQNSFVNYTWWKEMGRATEEFQFMRCGKAGDWKNHFTPEMNNRMNQEFIEPLKILNLSFDDID